MDKIEQMKKELCKKFFKDYGTFMLESMQEVCRELEQELEIEDSGE